MFFSKKPKTFTGRELLGEKRDIGEIVRGFPLSLLRVVANLVGIVLAPGLFDRFWPGIESRPEAIFYIAFGAVATLSGLCFRMSSSIDNGEYDKKLLVYAGGKFLHSSLQFLTGAIFSYVASMIKIIETPSDIDVEGGIQFLASIMSGLRWIPSYDWVQFFSSLDIESWLSRLFGWAAALMYWWAVDIAFSGVKTTHNVMWQRFNKV